MIAMSGGVDSSVALLLLKDKLNVIGATLKLIDSQESGIEDAKAVAERFNIPFQVFDFRELFRKEVIKRFSSGYLCGETPNPCVDCNRQIKFKALFEKANYFNCRYVATGHYARVEYSNEKGRWLLKKSDCNGRTNPKDQSYVLYNLTQEQLSRIIFPLGEASKDKVRQLAEKNELINSNKPDSQDICFIPDGNYGMFIRNFENIKIPKGDFIDKDGKVLGTHTGIIDYTIGQRRGLGVSAKEPLYVTAKNASTNTVTLGHGTELMCASLVACDLNWIAIENLTGEIKAAAKTRYNQKEQPCTIKPLDKGRVKVLFDEPQRALAPGQRAVFYDGDIVIGGGIIAIS
jgi:tRNA-specific 2-thiouridylase